MNFFPKWFILGRQCVPVRPWHWRRRQLTRHCDVCKLSCLCIGLGHVRCDGGTVLQCRCAPRPPPSFPRAATSVMLFTSFNMDRSCLQPSSINYFAHLSRLIASHNLLNHSYIACNCNCVFAENNAACYYANLRGPLFNECFLSKSSLWIRTRHSMRRLVSSEPMHVYALFTVFSWCSHASCKVLCVLLV